ncbi:MAG: hypothetical protein ACRDOJ_14210 [Nocardioidaceae bacterium]
MKAWLLLGLALAVSLAMSVGCAAEDAGTQTSAGDDQGALPDVPSVVRVEVSGGIQGVSDVHEVRRNDPPEGLGEVELNRILRLADSAAVRRFDGNHLPEGAVPCCDLRTLDVTVRHADGSRTRVLTAETLPAPAEFERLVALLSAVGG